MLCDLWPFMVPPPVDLQPDRAGKLDHSHPLSMCHYCRPPASQRGHCSATSRRDQEARAEDRHGREDEEDGRHAAVCCHWHQEEEDDPGSSRCHATFFLELMSGRCAGGKHFWTRHGKATYCYIISDYKSPFYKNRLFQKKTVKLNKVLTVWFLNASLELQYW